MFESRISAGAKEKQPTRASGKPDAETISSWSYDMEGHAKKCVERYCELTNKKTQQLHKVATPCMDDHQFREEEIGSVWKNVHNFHTNCSEVSILGTYWEAWYFMVCEQTCSCAHEMDKKLETKRLARLISYIHHTCECRLGLFQDSDFAEECKKQTSVPQCSTEAEIISRCRFTHGWDYCSRSFVFCDWSITFLTKSNQQNHRCKRVTGKPVNKHSTKHAKTDSNHAHQSRSDQHWSRSIKRDTFWSQC